MSFENTSFQSTWETCEMFSKHETKQTMQQLPAKISDIDIIDNVTRKYTACTSNKI